MWNYQKASMRYYRHALDVLGFAVNSWIEEAQGPSPTMCFAVDLGDLIDFKCKLHGRTQQALDRIRAHFQAFQNVVGPVHHCVGNHELYNLKRQEYIRELMLHTASPDSTSGLPPQDATNAYYSFTIPQAPSFDFVVLDTSTYGFSVTGALEGSTEHIKAVEFLAKRNPNKDKNSSVNMEGFDQRFVEYNGAIDPAQMHWLTQLLKRAEAEARNVIVFMHVPTHEVASGGHPAALLWNFDELLALFRQFSKCVRAVFSGHTHENDYACDHGIHFVGLHAALECPPSSSDDTSNDRAYASVDIFPRSLRIRGAGKSSKSRAGMVKDLKMIATK
ncbi:unnamed protein product [Aphanomyces euteiches]|nr:hypothetical protein AeRB84_003569 [Aphanomyces euteiches]